ncbi:MAG TPA: phosphatase PAP2 family protein [Nitriliruptorales bacterium]|nr:phosphatase PAP2 family protein [Nitriliruptorales bacterium]
MGTARALRRAINRRLRRSRLRRLDHRLFRAVARGEHPVADRVLPWFSRATDWSVGWCAVAGGLAVAGGGRGRRAALEGLTAIALTSVTVNHPVKVLARRQRPDRALVPTIRRTASQPGSWSFPSGHTASAFAFAIAASRRLPVMTPPLYAIAATVGVSRIHVGAHYPSDVLAGAVLGTAAGLAATKLLDRLLSVDRDDRPGGSGGATPRGGRRVSSPKLARSRGRGP